MSEALPINGDLRALLELLDAALDQDDAGMVSIAIPRERALALQFALRRYVAGKTLKDSFGKKRGPKGPRNAHADTIAKVETLRATDKTRWKIAVPANSPVTQNTLEQARSRQIKSKKRAAINDARGTLAALIEKRLRD